MTKTGFDRGDLATHKYIYIYIYTNRSDNSVGGTDRAHAVHCAI